MGIGSIIGSGITVGSSIATSSATNRANKNIAQLNNEWNMKMLERQMQYNEEAYERQLGDTWDFYNDAKAYNSAEAQVQRLRNAGLNPALTFGSGSAGSVSAASSPSVQGISAPSATPYSADYSGITQGIGAAVDLYMRGKQAHAEVSQKEATTNNLRIEGQYIAAKAIAELAKIRADTKSTETKTAIDGIIKSFLPQMQQADLNIKTNQNQQLLGALKLQNIETMMASKNLEAFDIRLKLELANSAAELQLKIAQEKLTKKQIETEIQKIAESMARESLIKQQTRTERARSEQQEWQTGFDKATQSDRIQIIEMELRRAINNVGPQTIVGGLYQGITGLGQKWRSTNPIY